MYEEKAMAYIFDEGSLSKLNSLMDSMPPSSSDLQCPICEVRMRTFSVPYTPADDHEGHRREYGNASSDTDDMAVGLVISLAVGAAKAIVPNTKQKIQLDACKECRMFWFDRSEKDELSYGIIG
jgi:Zn-finger nucleic acid-binding protein|tara:strand:- start:1961 stop:2332 length:372 start_codon:yes stop_codon:yes gene_type:complete